MKSIPFFLDTIRIRPHTAADVSQIGRNVTLREFSKGQPVSLYEMPSGDLCARVGRYPSLEFIEGPEV